MKMNNKERITALLLTAAIIIGGAGCGNKKIDAVNTTPPAVSTPAATATPTEMNATLAMAPDITGLTKQIQNDRVVYISKEGNAYGLEANSYAGQYKKEVTVEGTETGGVALVPKVAEKLLTDVIAKIPEGQNKLKVILPIDISQTDDSQKININSATYKEASLLMVNYNGKLPFVSVKPGENYFHRSTNSVSLSIKESGKEITLQNYTEINTVNPSGVAYITYLISQEFAPVDFSAHLNFGDKLGLDIGSPFMISIMNISKPPSTSISDLLTVDNHPVFIVATPTGGK